MTCPCDKFGDKFGCGDGYSHCGGFAGDRGNRKINELRSWLCEVMQPHPPIDGQVTATVNMARTPEKIELQFHGWALVLLSDGTWYPLDTSGG